MSVLGEGEASVPPAHHPVAWRLALRKALVRKSLCRTVPAATIVGSILFMVNLYSSVRDGPFTWPLVGQITLTFLVPWMNATMGIAIGVRHGGPSSVGTATAGSSFAEGQDSPVAPTSP